MAKLTRDEVGWAMVLQDKGQSVRGTTQRDSCRQPYELEDVPLGQWKKIQIVLVRNRIRLGSALVQINQAHRASRGGWHDEALAVFREAAAADPHSPEPYHGLGRLHTFLGNCRCRKAMAASQILQEISGGPSNVTCYRLGPTLGPPQSLRLVPQP